MQDSPDHRASWDRAHAAARHEPAENLSGGQPPSLSAPASLPANPDLLPSGHKAWRLYPEAACALQCARQKASGAIMSPPPYNGVLQSTVISRRMR
jgi:hypothetical protein